MSKTQWGNAVWFLFHTLAEKLRPEYSREAPIILNHFRGICSNLPCPTCSHHAMHNLRTMNTRHIQNKFHLQQFFHIFHNKVNDQLRKPNITLQQCRQMYYYANTRNIILNFKRFMTLPSGNPKLMIGNQNKMQHVNNILSWLQMNLYKFYP